MFLFESMKVLTSLTAVLVVAVLEAGRGDFVALPSDLFRSGFDGVVVADKETRVKGFVGDLADKVDDVPFNFGFAVSERVVGFAGTLLEKLKLQNVLCHRKIILTF